MNMGYCRFENILSDLKECKDHLADEMTIESERVARVRLIKMCVEIAQDYGKEAK